jgi:hypothetical protein
MFDGAETLPVLAGVAVLKVVEKVDPGSYTFPLREPVRWPFVSLAVVRHTDGVSTGYALI